MYDYDRERWEAIDAGRKALDSLYMARKELDSAKNWGIFDMLGGGLITDIIKHSKMNNGQRYLEQARYDLECFSRELRDVSNNIDLSFNVADFWSFCDIFSDGLFSDLIVQDRINKTRYQLDEAIRRVEDILDRI